MKFVEDRLGHDYRYALKTDYIKKELNWEPKYMFEDGLAKTINWYINNKNWWKSLN